MAIAAARRRADSDEHRIGILHRFSGIRREVEALLPDVLRNQRVEAGLVDRHDAGLQFLDLGHVLVDAGHDMAEIGETGPGHEADIARSDNCDTHGNSLR